MATYKQFPAILNIEIVQGDDLETSYQLTLNGTNVDITSYTFSAYVKQNDGVEVNGVTSIIDAANGIFQVRYEDTGTIGIPAGVHSHVVIATVGANTRTYITGEFGVVERGGAL